MSRIGKQQIIVQSAVKVDIDGAKVRVRGPKGNLSREVNAEMRLHLEDGMLTVTRPSDEPRHRAMHGLTRALIANMVTGVDAGFRKTLELQGVGYRAFVDMRATELGLSGWVRNRRDGSVEAVLQGPPAAVEDMLEMCRKGPPAARVDNVEVIGEGVGAFDGFEVRPTV